MEGQKTLSDAKEYHRPVLLKEAADVLIPAPWGAERDAWYLDATLGDGGHTIEIIKRGGKVIGIDQDPQALERAQKRFDSLGIEHDRYILIRGNFRDINNLILQMDPSTSLGANQKFAGAIFDLGVSSMQLESPERGFSFQKSGPLDMRMDPGLQVKALDLVSALNKGELYELFSKLGEEKYSKKLADALVSAREVIGYRLQGTGYSGIRTTRDLADVVESVVGRKHGRIHPATRVFQALRIAVNDELNALKEGLDQVKDLIKNNDSILVISFHSLEDRIVKTTFRKWEFEGLGKVLTKKPIVPSEDEIGSNPRARSAKMRVFKHDYHKEV